MQTHNTYSLVLTLSRTHTNTHSLSLSHTHAHTHTHTHTYPHIYTHTHTHTHTHTTHTHARAQELTRLQTKLEENAHELAKRRAQVDDLSRTLEGIHRDTNLQILPFTATDTPLATRVDATDRYVFFLSLPLSCSLSRSLALSLSTDTPLATKIDATDRYFLSLSLFFFFSLALSRSHSLSLNRYPAGNDG